MQGEYIPLYKCRYLEHILDVIDFIFIYMGFHENDPEIEWGFVSKNFENQ